MHTSGQFPRGRHAKSEGEVAEVPRVSGGCVACGHQSLVLIGSRIWCDRAECPNPEATSKILLEPMVLVHLVSVGEESFSIQHPLIERLDDRMFYCPLHSDLAAQPGPPAEPGLYQVTTNAEGQWEFTFIRSSFDD